MMFSKLKLKEILLDIFDIVAFLVFVGGIVLCIRFFIANPYTVVWASMSPTFEENDFIIVDKVSPRFSPWKRGDIIVFVPPGKTIPYIKRVVGLPGETVTIENGQVSVCMADVCEVLDESYLPEWLQTRARCGLTSFPIEGEWLFVLGDNRWFSTDSSCCFGLGCYDGANYLVPYDHIIGKVYVRLFPGFSTYY
jgi:signal peptidase I